MWSLNISVFRICFLTLPAPTSLDQGLRIVVDSWSVSIGDWSMFFYFKAGSIAVFMYYTL